MKGRVVDAGEGVMWGLKGGVVDAGDGVMWDTEDVGSSVVGCFVDAYGVDVGIDVLGESITESTIRGAVNGDDVGEDTVTFVLVPSEEPVT